MRRSAGGCRGGSEPLRGRAAVRDRPPDGEEDAELFVAAGVSAVEAGAASEAGRVHRHRRRDPGGGPDPEVPRMQRHTAYRIFERLRCLARSADRSLRGLRVCAGPGLLDRPGAIPSRGLLGAGGSAWALHTAQQRLAGPVNRPDRGSHPTAGERHPAGHGVAQGEHQPIGRRCAGMVDGDECADPDHLVKRKDIVNEISDFAASQSTIGAVDGTAPHL